MARVLDEFPQRRFQKAGGPPERYPWTDWFDGQIWMLTEGKDFDSQAGTFKTNMYHKARTLGITIRIAHDTENRTLYVQALDD